MIISEATKIICKSMFENVEIFDRDFLSLNLFCIFKIYYFCKTCTNSCLKRIIITVDLLFYCTLDQVLAQLRRELFSKKSRMVENIPPALDALRLYIKRAQLQSR